MLEALLSETLDVLGRAERASTKTIRLEPVQSNFTNWVVLDGADKELTLRYDPSSISVDYTIAEAAMRLCRYFSCPASRRRVLSASPEGRARAYARMADDTCDLPPLVREKCVAGFPTLYDGLLTHLASQPGEFWINQRLYDEYPGLRADISLGLSDALSRALTCLSPEAESVTPFAVYVACNSQNAAFSSFASELLGRPEIFLPYVGSAFEECAYDLRRLNPRDRGWGGDVVAIDRWATVLGVRGWYGWKR